MTNLEFIKASAAINYPIEDETFNVCLIGNDLIPTAQYSKSTDEKSMDLSVADVALKVIFGAKKLMDDGYTIELQDIDDLWDLRWYYRNKWGLPDDRPKDDTKFPTLRDGSFKW